MDVFNWGSCNERTDLRNEKEWPLCVDLMCWTDGCIELRGNKLNITQIYKLSLFQYGEYLYVALCQLIACWAHMFHSIYNIKNRSENEKSSKVKECPLENWSFLAFSPDRTVHIELSIIYITKFYELCKRSLTPAFFNSLSCCIFEKLRLLRKLISVNLCLRIIKLMSMSDF